ncbi:aldo/keto reductase [Olivibacter sitiensis]|uniref:aldo/keto reductase n=1 Tax=Olivibacter sitiensis TaxID=376470 RepID=UPI000424128D|nr:aldo/keto reductase [Olivibacter sitiensis]
MDRRKFIKQSSVATAGLVASTSIPAYASTFVKSSNMTSPFENSGQHRRFRPKYKAGFGGVALGNGFQQNPDIECIQSVEAAWDAGIRYFDTSPWYGLGISERRMGMYLKDKPREEFVLSTKVGRLLPPHENFKLERGLWKSKLNFEYKYDYTAAGVRRSVEDSLQRLGLSSLDIVFIHDLSPDNGDMKENWVKYFDEAATGAMPELTKMREEGLIKAWGFGVNTIEPILKAIEVADPDIFLSACQYSLIKHEDDLNKVFPKAAERDISIVVGAPLCAGFLAGKDRYLYDGKFPDGVKEKLAALKRVAANHQVDLRTAALQFAAAPDVVSGVIPGAHTAQQAQENAASFKAKIPTGFWAELKSEKLIAENAPTPNV